MPTSSIKETWDSEDSPWPTSPINFLVRVTLQSGMYGVGEISTQLWYLNETPEQILSIIAAYDRVLKLADPTNLALCHSLMLNCYGSGIPGARGARSGVDMALFDVVGRLWEVPSYKLMGGAANACQIPLMFCTYQNTADKAIADCRAAIARGFKALKIKVGDRLIANGWNFQDLTLEADKLAATLKCIPGHIMVDADANQAWWNEGSTISVLRSLAHHRNLSMEQPLSYDNVNGSAHVRAASGVPQILDESVWSAEAMIRIVQAKACDRIVLKLARVGGMFEARKIIAICEAAAIGVSLDTAPYTVLGDTAVFHTAISCRHVFPVDEGHQSMIALNCNWFSGGVTIKDGCASVPDVPGLGIEVDWSLVK
ncbi:mandelate racemase/muconate lactonizing enzyme family protein [Caballeronia eucalypticola]|uniref:mandelate racemase/muconate lactonizing enzyme family protein n=1 Tax=Caballeronia sp. 15715 TaxID=3391030 RepID=UPI0039E57476